MSHNLQEVFQKFGFSKRKTNSNSTNNKGVNNHSNDDDDDHKHHHPNHNHSNSHSHSHNHNHSSSRSSRSSRHSKASSSTNPNSEGHKVAKSQRDILEDQQKYLEYLKRKQLEFSNRNNNNSQTTNTSASHTQNSQSNPSKSSAMASIASSNGNSNAHKARPSSKHHPNGVYAHLDPILFTPNMTTQQIQNLMGLRSPPLYQTDEKGYIEFQPGLFIRNQLVLLDTLGRGTFSKVFEAIDVMDQTRVAIKVIRNTHRYIEAAKTELRVLQHITNFDDGSSSCIHLKDHFSWQNHPCFVFKLYGPSIYTVMSRNRFRPFPDQICRSLAFQICNAIQFLHHLGIIFTDLKPENMVFVNGQTFPIKIHGKTHLIPLDTRIKIVDFGSAVYEPRYDANNAKTWKFKDGYNYLIQTRHYRAPEVVLEMPWKRPVDIWSVGCVILEFLYGSMVFNTHCPIDHLNQMQKMIGVIPRDLVRSASHPKYKELFHHPEGTLRLENARRSRAQARRLETYFNLSKMEHRHLFDLVARCLKWRANERIQGHQLLKHDYFKFIKNLLSHRHKFSVSHHSQSHASDKVAAAPPNDNNIVNNNPVISNNDENNNGNDSNNNNNNSNAIHAVPQNMNNN